MSKLAAILFLSLACSGSGSLMSQTFSYGELSLIKTQQVLIEQYTGIQIPKPGADEPMLNRFDNGNPYTYLQVVKDVKNNSYHILFQTSFMGKLLFLAFSNNLGNVFNRPDKPMFFFSRCMKEVQQYILSMQIADAALKCVLARLNYCTD
jgi:hypothetical protein